MFLFVVVKMYVDSTVRGLHAAGLPVGVDQRVARHLVRVAAGRAVDLVGGVAAATQSDWAVGSTA